MSLQELLGSIRGQMSKDNDVFSISDMLQNIIYFFNSKDIRDYLINHHIKLLPSGKTSLWDGTYYFDEKGQLDPYYHPEHKQTFLREFVQQRKNLQQKKSRFVLFTCCILYEGNRVHYLSFIYDTKKRILLSFDPGVHLYTKGQDVLVPLVRNAFINNNLIGNDHRSFERVGLCKTKYYDKTWGIQYDGSDPNITDLPADSFCQSWTLFFLIEFLRHRCSDRFFNNWCSIPPKHREVFVIMNYFMPHLQNDAFVHKRFRQFYPQGDLTKLSAHVIDMFPKKNN